MKSIMHSTGMRIMHHAVNAVAHGLCAGASSGFGEAIAWRFAELGEHQLGTGQRASDVQNSPITFPMPAA
jgi:NADP-dependent 3-hydroxy acid dehydrogenase YdfG